jgi:hypothetical protein
MEPAEATNTRRSRQIGVAVALALGLVVAFVAGRMEAPSGEPLAVPTTVPRVVTTPGATAVDAVLGEPLQWRKSLTLGGLLPMSLVDHEGILYLFGTASHPDSPQGPGDLRGWMSRDGGDTWEWMGTVVPSPHSIRAVVSTPSGLVALSSQDGGVAPRVMISPDGVDWSVSELPIDQPMPDWSSIWLQAAGGTGSLLVVFGRTDFDVGNLVADVLPEQLRSKDGRVPYGLGISSPPLRVTVKAPLGITVFSASAEDLGLSDEQAAAILSGGHDGPSTVWASRDGGASWTRSEIEAVHVSHVGEAPDGDLLVVGWLGSGDAAIWTSSDGVGWERQPTPRGAYLVLPWRDALIGFWSSPTGTRLVRSTGGAAWESLAVDRLLPTGGYWAFGGAMGVGDAGVAVTASGFSNPEPAVGEKFVLEKDEYTLTVDDTTGVLVLTRGDAVVLRVGTLGDQVIPDVVADFQAGTITFLDPATGEGLVTLTFEEIEVAQSRAFMGGEYERQAIVFSTDGVTWSVQDTAEIVGEGVVRILHVADDRVIAVVAKGRLWWSPAGSSVTDTEIWLAPVP